MAMTPSCDLRRFLNQALPEFHEVGVLMEMLESHGFTQVEDLVFLDPERDLSNILNLLQCRKLAAKVKDLQKESESQVETSCPETTETISTIDEPVPGPSTSSEENFRHHVAPSIDWAEKFEIPWQNMNQSLLDNCRDQPSADLMNPPADPPHPHIRFTGEHPFDNNNCRLIVESCVVLHNVSFRLALAAMFAVYYVLNMAYPDEGSVTLEFIQRIFVGINPPRGTKGRKRKSSAMSRIAKFIAKMKEFDPRWNMDEN